ncbi:MAG TPA: hypothetical protein VHD32_03250 [Candidatus Didemnitutus sp.]|nr:hypothetical protein [Candidatus Didemnitutus sp.]
MPIKGIGEDSTLRLDLRYQTASWSGLSFLVDMNGVYAIGHTSFRIPTLPSQNQVGYPTINDPAVTDLHQLELLWTIPSAPIKIKVGRDELQLNNGRFLGNSLWRQTPQTIDLAQVSAALGDGFGVQYTYFDRVHRTIGKDATDGTLNMNSHLGNLTWAKPDVVAASAYVLLLDYQRPDQWVNSTSTSGIRLTGPYKLNKDFGLYYTADFAHQKDYARNPNHVSVDYWDFEFGVEAHHEDIFVGWTELGAKSSTDKLSTPLAPPFYGWVEKFGPNPTLKNSAGLDARYITATGPVPGVAGLTHTITYYDYYAVLNRVHYGHEIDLGLEWKAKPIAKNLLLGIRFGDYFAAALYTHSVRIAPYSTLQF